ncbi:MAG TPA: ATP-binding protein [Blastocatellia bacterium]|nr:ATP-binding protein [Blastocatellia bacterium]
MSVIQILKLVGCATGAVLYLYIAWLLWQRRRGTGTWRQKIKLLDSETAFTLLALCMAAWFSGNLLNTIHILFLGSQASHTTFLRAWDTITVIGIALVPSVMLHSHIAFWAWVDGYKWMSTSQVRRWVLLVYIPMLAMPVTVYKLNTGVYKEYPVKLHWVLIPYSTWFLMSLCASAAIDWRMRDKLYQWAVRESAFLKRLAIMLIAIGVFEFLVVGVLGHASSSDPLWVVYMLMSLMPPFTVAHYIYRYHPFQLVIKDSLVYAAFALIFIMVYTYGVRYLMSFLTSEYSNVVEAVLILAMVVLAGPVVRLINRAVQVLFAREIGLYRDVVRQVTTGVAGLTDLDSLVRYAEATIQNGLDLKRVRIVPLGSDAAPDGLESGLAERITERHEDVIQYGDELKELGATAAYALRRENRLVGLMLITAEARTLTSEKHAVLEVLSGQVAIAIESCRLVEDKVRLERELASRERLALLGQMAATVAHEVKNPLSSIKSIAQVMREDESLSEHEGGLKLIVSEIDRLNRTVSQLLAFSRPSSANGAAAQGSTALSELVDSTVSLLKSEVAERQVNIQFELDRDIQITGAQVTPVREILSNLLINAIHASPVGGSVSLEAVIEQRERPARSRSVTAGDRHSTLVMTVTDDGAGIPDDAQVRVFEPFYTTKPRGSGLGLAIVQRRAAELGATVNLTSPVNGGRGTCFRVAVPLGSPAERSSVSEVEVRGEA